MFCIDHNSDNFTIIDCCLSEDNQERIVDEIVQRSTPKGVVRFISTHPDDDHFRGIGYLDERLGIRNFYCVKNTATKEEMTDHFDYYCDLRDHETKAFYIKAGCKRRWMNVSSDEREHAGIHVLWPELDNPHFIEALETAEDAGRANNISAVIRYVTGRVGFLWMGDLETEFMEKISDAITWPQTDIVFAAHHGRASGRIPHAILDQLKPKIIVLGEAPARHLHYYGGYNILTQNSAGDITFECGDGKAHIFVSEPEYSVDFLQDEGRAGGDFYIGTLSH